MKERFSQHLQVQGVLMVTREEAIRAAAYVLVEARIARDLLSPRAAAEAAWYPGHRLGSVEAIEALIVEQRAEATCSAAVSMSPAQSAAEDAA